MHAHAAVGQQGFQLARGLPVGIAGLQGDFREGEAVSFGAAQLEAAGAEQQRQADDEQVAVRHLGDLPSRRPGAGAGREPFI